MVEAAAELAELLSNNVLPSTSSPDTLSLNQFFNVMGSIKYKRHFLLKQFLQQYDKSHNFVTLCDITKGTDGSLRSTTPAGCWLCLLKPPCFCPLSKMWKVNQSLSCASGCKHSAKLLF